MTDKGRDCYRLCFRGGLFCEKDVLQKGIQKLSVGMDNTSHQFVNNRISN